jgi:hypothetical protein
VIAIDKSKFMKDVLSHDVLTKEEMKIREQEPSEMRNKMITYNKLVKNTRMPKISKYKREEIELNKQRFFNDR